MKKFISKIAVYFFGQVLSKIIVVILMPVQTKYIDVGVFGYNGNINNMINIVTSIVCLEVWTGVLRYTFEYKEREGKIKVISNGMLMMIGSIIIYSIGFEVFRRTLGLEYAGMIFVLGLVNIIDNTYRGCVRGLGKNTIFMISGVLATITNVATFFIFRFQFNLQLESLVLSSCASHVVPIIFMEITVGVLYRFRRKHIDKSLLKSMIVYCLPLSVNTIAYWLLTGVNKLAIINVLGDVQAGYYEIASRFTMVVTIIVSVFNMAWQEISFESGNDVGREKQYTTVLRHYMRFIGGCVLLLIPATFIGFPLLVNEQYEAAKAIVPIFYLGTYASTISSFVGTILCAEKMTQKLFTTAVWGGIVNVIILFTLLKTFGIQVATISFAISFAVNVFMRLRIVKKTFPTFKVDIKYIGIFLGLFVLSSAVYFSNIMVLNIGWAVVLVGAMAYTSRELYMPIVKSIKAKRLENKSLK